MIQTLPEVESCWSNDLNSLRLSFFGSETEPAFPSRMMGGENRIIYTQGLAQKKRSSHGADRGYCSFNLPAQDLAQGSWGSRADHGEKDGGDVALR